MDIKSLYYDEGWMNQSIELMSLGYTMHEIDGSIIPAVFTRPNSPDLYLYMPNDQKMSNRSWVPRALADKPRVFSVVDAAEHIGCSASTIRHAIYHDKSNPLVPDHKIGERGGLIFMEETLAGWHKKRPGPGPPPSESYMTVSRLYLTNKRFMLNQLKRRIISGKQDPTPIISAILSEGSDFTREQLTEMARTDLGHFVAEASRLEKSSLIDLIAEKETA